MSEKEIIEKMFKTIKTLDISELRFLIFTLATKPDKFIETIKDETEKKIHMAIKTPRIPS